MNRLLVLKRMLAVLILCCAAAVGLSAGNISAIADSDSSEEIIDESSEEMYDESIDEEVGDFIEDYTEDYTDYSAEDYEESYTDDASSEQVEDATESVQESTDTEQTSDTNSEDLSDSSEESSDESTSTTVTVDTSIYTDKLNEIAQKQAELEAQLADTEGTILTETERQQLILEEINTINEKISVVNSYMTQLETQIYTEQQAAQELKSEIDKGIEEYKLRLRAMYIAGDMGYVEMILSSGDFYDVLMRTELYQRVTEYDNQVLDDLVTKKAEYDDKVAELEKQQAEYDSQSSELEDERAELAELYNSSEETKQLLADEKAALEEQQEAYENEIYSYEGILGDLLKGTYTGSTDEETRLQTETAASAALEVLHEQINERKAAGEEIDDTECQYTFKWPVAGHYYVSSGVGERWGSYHKGLDITGESGCTISASEAGTVVRVNNSCTHNYGKTESCGCGGGYGNYVIVDHGNGFLTLYGHLTQATVEVGDTVAEGQSIGLMGSTGNSTGTHLHFELRYNGYITNPASFVSY